MREKEPNVMERLKKSFFKKEKVELTYRLVASGGSGSDGELVYFYWS